MADKPTEKPKGEITADQEVKAMNTVVKALTPLDPEPRGRVLAWGNDRFGKREDA